MTIYNDTISETADSADDVLNTAVYKIISAETANNADANTAGFGYRDTLSESLTAADTLYLAIVAKVIESASVDDSIITQLALRISESMSVAALAFDTLRVNVSISETLSYQDTLRIVYEMLVQEGIDIADIAAGNWQAVIGIVETLLLSGSVTDTSIVSLAIAESILYQATLSTAQGVSVAESIVISGTLQAKARKLAQLIEQAVIDDNVTQGMRVYGVISDSMSFTDDATALARLHAAISDGFIFTVKVKLGDLAFIGTVMNLQNMAVSEYTGYNFNSIAPIADTYFGANESGIYELVGENDAGNVIAARLTTGITNFDSNLKKIVTRAYIGFRNDGAVFVKVIADGGKSYTYELDRSDEFIHVDRLKFAKGVKASYFQFELSNTDADGTGGADFELDNMEVFPLILDRKIRYQ